MTPEELCNCFPYHYYFMPSSAVWEKLIKRMSQVKEGKESTQLWRGFTPKAGPKKSYE